MPNYCEVYWYEGGAFKERRSHSSPKAAAIFDQSVAKFSKSNTDKVIVNLRYENHELIRTWSNLQPADVGNSVSDFRKRKWKSIIIAQK